MPAKYHIHAHAAPPRFPTEGKLGIVDWREDCSSCHNCVKKGCVYGFYREETDLLRDDIGYLDYIYKCKGCLTCIQNCTKNILTRVVNPEYERLGDEYFRPDIILTTWYQAETGAVPVSGCGYGGPFSGSGFDSMWTDMSEIVRPTRDGIHGREYINTSVDIGRKLKRLNFSGDTITDTVPPLLSSPLPLMFDMVAEQWRHPVILSAMVKVAAELKLFAIIDSEVLAGMSVEERAPVIPLFTGTDPVREAAGAQAPMIILPDSENILETVKECKSQNSQRIVAVRVTAGTDSFKRVTELAGNGVEVINLRFDSHGREEAGKQRHMRDVIREVHGELIRQGLRDEVTLFTSGGIALPEHMAKAIICGTDLVAIDIPLIVALECRLCGQCALGGQCSIGLATIDEHYAVSRMINLMGSWHSQLLEMLGAMGIREARRLRGEVGRCMFFEDLERAAFGRLFGKRLDRKN
ncbi:MAG: hypothetical protein JW863_05825 [Chitinispirillaceae bacterium]|nr:hypothetical protein [Chitinispirillaceae bacterium]